MSSTTLHANQQIPRTFGIIERPRLLEKLQGVLAHRATLISAPPGYGKTTVAAQFARQTSLPVAWHTVEERERDVPNLYTQSTMVLEAIASGIQSMTPQYGYAPGELASLIADYLRDTLRREAIYVLDDVQHLTGSPAAETWLRTLVQRLPASCHVILISRTLPDLPFAEMIARREILAIGQEELRLTPQEIAALAHEIIGSTLSPPQIQDLAARLEGWPAGTVLALHPLPPDLERAMLSGGQGPEALFDALAQTMLQAQPSSLRDFILASSTLPRLTPELCSQALGLPDSANWLTEIGNRNLFLSRVTGGLAYHRLFRNFLQNQLKTTRPDFFVSLHTSAARWFERHDRIDEAFDHYMAAGLYDRAVAISERVAQAYFTQGKIETLLSWNYQLQEARVQAPRLLCTCAKAHTDRYEYDLAEAELNEAQKGFARRKDLAGLADVQLQRALLNLQRGNYQEAASQSQHLLDYQPATAKLSGQAMRILGVTHLRLGEVETAVGYLEESLSLHREDGDAYALTNLLQDLSVAYSRLGRLDEASACLQEVVALRRSLGSAGALALALNNLGYYYHRGSDYKQALATFQEGLSVVARVPNRRAESYLLWSLGDLQRDRDAWNEALQLYHRALELLGSSEPALRSAILVSESTLRRWQGKMLEAVSLAKEAAGLADLHNIALESAIAQAALWAARSQLGSAAEALEHLNMIVSVLQKQSARFELVRVYGLCAHTALLSGDKAGAEAYLRLAVEMAQAVHSAQPLVAEIAHTPPLEPLAVTYDLLTRDLKRLREVQIKPSYPASTNDRIAITYSLRVLTLGQETVERDGHLVSSSEWRAVGARELFFYLLFAGPASREDIGLVFWPDNSTKSVRANFHTTLYRARHALGENVIAFQDGRYLVNPELDLWCDASEIETLTRQARLLPPRDARTEDLWRRAVDLYHGDFLQPLDADWVLPRREALREAYIEALMGLGECARARKDSREALSMFRRALEIEPYREDIHRAILICYAEKGEKQQILQHLNELKVFLWDELGVEPSAETLSLARTLLR